MIIPIFLDALGIYQLASGSQFTNVPSWVWFQIALLVFLIIPFIAFHKLRVQRDELQAKLQKGKDTPKLPSPPELEIIYINNKCGIENGANIVTICAEYRPTGKMNIEQLELHLLGRRIPSSDWRVMKASQDLWFTSDNKFELPRKTSSGEHSAELFAFANGEWWRSQSFSIDITINPERAP